MKLQRCDHELTIGAKPSHLVPVIGSPSEFPEDPPLGVHVEISDSCQIKVRQAASWLPLHAFVFLPDGKKKHARSDSVASAVCEAYKGVPLSLYAAEQELVETIHRERIKMDLLLAEPGGEWRPAVIEPNQLLETSRFTNLWLATPCILLLCLGFLAWRYLL